MKLNSPHRNTTQGAPIEWITTAELARDSVRLAELLPPDTARIVGIPRSGMIPASIIAAHLHLPLWELTGGFFRRLASGSRGFGTVEGQTVVVDDTVYNGSALRKAREEMRGQPARFAAVYCKDDRVGDVDFYVRTFRHSDDLLEWNFFNNHWYLLHGVACDFDGVFCYDPTIPDYDEGPGLERYREWLTQARPLHLPRARPVELIVTARLERFRCETEAWLKKWGVSFRRLIMNPADRASQRGDVAAIKAQAYFASSCRWFVESDPRQAERIFEISKKRVICPAIAKIWSL